MPYVGNIPAEKYASFEVQHFTTSATTSYTLTHAVANELDIRLVLNNVVQQPGGSYAYTASATTLTLSSATTSSDTLYCVYIGKAVQTVTPPDGSVSESKLQVSNSPTNGYVLSAQSAASGGLTWAADAAGTVTGYTNGVDDRVITSSGATTLNGEANLTFDGSTLAVTADVITGFQDTAPTATSMGTAHANDSTLLLGGLNSGATQGSLYVGGQNVAENGVEGAVYGFSGGSQNAGIEFLEGSGDAYGQISMKVGQGTGGTLVEAMRIDSGGHTTIKSLPGISTTETLLLTTALNANPAYANLAFKSGGNTSGVWIKGIQASGGNDGELGFYSNNSGSLVEAIRIRYDGFVGIGVNAPNSALHVSNATTSTIVKFHKNNTGDSDFMRMRNERSAGATTGNMISFRNSSDVEVGLISSTNSATAYATSSDYRLKNFEKEIDDGIDRIKELKPYRFNFKTNPETTLDGFFAHEVSSIVPEAIHGTKDAMHPEVLYADEVLYTAEDELPEGISIGDIKTYADKLPEGKNIGDVKEETKIKPQGIDQSKLVPLLTSALQEAITKIETLETANTNKDTKITALETSVADLTTRLEALENA